MTNARAKAPPRRRCGGFSLIEISVICAVVGLLAVVAMPSYSHYLLRVGRLDAVRSLTRIQIAQEQRRNTTGQYAKDLASLGGIGAVSDQGHYRISVAGTGPESYRAEARSVDSQARDRACETITLEVSSGFPQAGPLPVCWGR